MNSFSLLWSGVKPLPTVHPCFGCFGDGSPSGDSSGFRFGLDGPASDTEVGCFAVIDVFGIISVGICIAILSVISAKFNASLFARFISENISKICSTSSYSLKDTANCRSSSISFDRNLQGQKNTL